MELAQFYTHIWFPTVASGVPVVRVSCLEVRQQTSTSLCAPVSRTGHQMPRDV